MKKIMKIEDAIKLIHDGDILGIGGNVLNRAPMALVREIVRQGVSGLKIVKTAGAMDVDLLCFADAVYSVDAGFISYESEYSLAQHYRKAVQSGKVKGNEHACYTVISALRAAETGVPFMPVKGLMISDLIDVNDYFTRILDPFTGESVTVVKAIVPDVVIIHAQEADQHGNARIDGPVYEDLLFSKAGRKVIVSCETIVPDSKFAFSKEKANIPHYLVDAVVHIPKGASPASCSGKYEIDRKSLDAFKALTNLTELEGYLKSYETNDRR